VKRFRVRNKLRVKSEILMEVENSNHPESQKLLSTLTKDPATDTILEDAGGAREGLKGDLDMTKEFRTCKLSESITNVSFLSTDTRNRQKNMEVKTGEKCLNSDLWSNFSQKRPRGRIYPSSGSIF